MKFREHGGGRRVRSEEVRLVLDHARVDGQTRALLRSLGLTDLSPLRVCKRGDPCIVQVRTTSGFQDEAKRLGVRNFSILVSHVMVPPAIKALLGMAAYAKKYQMVMVVPIYERAAAVTTADVAAVRDTVRDELEGRRLVADFPNYTAEPRPDFQANVRAGNPFGVAVQGQTLFVVDASQNVVRRVDR